MLYNLLCDKLDADIKLAINIDDESTYELIQALQGALVNNSTLSLPFWADKIGVDKMEEFTFAMQEWLDIVVRNKFSSIAINRSTLAKYMTQKEIDNYRISTKLKRYMPRYVRDVQPANLTRTPSGIRDTGIIRRGFAMSANSTYRYDTDMIAKYYNTIILNTNKGINKVAKKFPHLFDDEANYAELATLVIDNILANPGRNYNMEANISDMRGRASYIGLKRVFNPIGYKDARACLVIPAVTITNSLEDKPARDNIYRFIAELLGLKRGKYSARILAGMVAYNKRTLPTENLMKECKDLHQLMWLERIYNQLDTLTINGTVEWTVPIELDASMSLAQISGVLTNDERLLDKTNVINPDNMQDPWYIEGVKRLSAKTQVAVFYGSSASTQSLLKSADIEVDKTEVKAINREFSRGAFSVIKALKNALIKTSSVSTPEYQVNLWGEKFTIEVNKFKTVAAELNVYKVWNPSKQRTKQFFMHKPIRIPDYKRFQLFQATCLIHGIDGIVANRVTEQAINTGEWILSIHDAWVCSPKTRVPHLYTEQLNLLSKDKETILNNYRESIGCTGPKADKAFRTVQELVHPLEGELKACESCLK